MSIHADATFEIKSWDEKPYSEIHGGGKLTRASVTRSFQGDIEGTGTLEYLMVYDEDGTASFIGLERVVGRIGERSGSFVLQHGGTYDGGAVTATWFVVGGSGTGELRGVRGRGEGSMSGQAQHYPMALDYDFES